MHSSVALNRQAHLKRNANLSTAAVFTVVNSYSTFCSVEIEEHLKATCKYIQDLQIDHRTFTLLDSVSVHAELSNVVLTIQEALKVP